MFGYDVDGRRVLEVGCGIGLASLVLNRREADITATDQHPRAEAFLRLNAGLNDDAEIPFVRTDWVDDEDELGEFDLIIGSDLLYERDHVDALSSFIARHARATSEVLYVDGGRGMAGRFTTALTSFGFEATDDAPSMPDMVPPARGRVLRFRRNG